MARVPRWLLAGLLAAPVLAAPASAAPATGPAVAAEAAQAEAAFNALPEAERSARLEAAGRMMTAGKMEDQLRQSLKSTVGFLLPIFLKGNETHQDTVMDIVTEEFLLQSEKMVPLLAEQMRRRYAELFNAVELDGLANFYKSSVGQKFIAVSPELQARLMHDGGPVGEAAAQAALPRIIDRLKASNLNVPNRS